MINDFCSMIKPSTDIKLVQLKNTKAFGFPNKSSQPWLGPSKGLEERGKVVVFCREFYDQEWIKPEKKMLVSNGGESL